MKKVSYFLLLLFFCRLSAFSQIPKDNPFYVRYHIRGHWTDTLRWKNVTDASHVGGLVDSNGHVDSLILVNTMKAISAAGGGVLYFKAGNYYFDCGVIVPETVVLRGANPPVRDAANARYRPPTKFNFPKYVPSFEGTGTPDNTAFKSIILWAGKSVGIVNIDVNRASIFVPFFASPNIIIFGLRSNNSQDIRHPFLSESKNRGWERYPTGDNANLVITYTNAVVANCRVNDSITDDFEMRDFMTNDGIFFKAIKFQYAFQVGMRLNSHTDTSEIILRDNYVKAYYASNILANFGGKKHVSNNEFIDVACQDYITNEFYSRARQQRVQDAFGPEQAFAEGSDTLHYLLLKPKNYDPKKKYPFVLFLHGNGQHGNSDPLVHFVFLYARDSVEKKYPSFVVVPHIKSTEKFYTSFSKPPTKALENSIDLVKELEKTYSIDSGRKYIAGVSSGGIGAAGIDDDNPHISAVRSGIAALNKFGINVEYFEYDNIAHWSWVPMGDDSRFLNLIFR